MTPYTLVEVYPSFWGTCCLHNLCQWWKQQVSLKLRYTYTRTYDITYSRGQSAHSLPWEHYISHSNLQITALNISHLHYTRCISIKAIFIAWSESSWLFISVTQQPALYFLTSSHTSKHTHWINCIRHLLLLERMFRCDSHYTGSTATFMAHCFCSPQVGMISDECIEWCICWNVFVDYNRL